MTDQSEIHKNKLTGKTYISKRIGLEADRKIRIASKVMDGEALRYAVEKDELLLRQTPTRCKQIIAKFLEDDRGLTVVTLQVLIAKTYSIGVNPGHCWKSIDES